MRLPHSRKLALSVGLALSLAAGIGRCDPWISPGDEVLRHHIEQLADAELIKVPITTWPLMWSGIAKDIANIDASNLPPDLQQSLAYVRNAWQRQTQPGLQVNARAEAGRGPVGYSDFGTTRREQDESSAGVSAMGQSWAGRLQATVATDPVDGKRYRPDGSYLAGFLGNWGVSAGCIDRWWGPGWQNSLILSDAARPVPGISLQRNNSDAFETPWLSWLGPWQFNAFIGELESSKVPVPNAKLFGARLSFKPFNSLELGLSRTAQWGGAGRNQSLHNFARMVLGFDNAGSDHITKANDPSNQEAGYDARFSFIAGQTENALYAQMIGEDNAGGLPSRFFYLGGAETSFAAGNVQNRLALEGSQTDAGGFGSKPYYNYVYEHFTYTEGYRYLGRPLGAALDNDSRTLSLLGKHFLPEHRELSWTLAWLDINMDGKNRLVPGGNVFGAQRTRTTYAELGYAFPLYKQLQLTAGADYYHKALHLDGETIGSGLFTKLELPL